MKRQFTATCYIIHEEKVLLIYHKKFHKWLPPGGHIEENETPEEAAIREAKEETGLFVTIVLQENVWIPTSNPNAHSIPRPYLCLLENIPAYKDQEAHQHIDYIFLSKPNGPIELATNEEHPLRWFSKEEVLQIPSQDIFPDTVTIVSHVLLHASLNLPNYV